MRKRYIPLLLLILAPFAYGAANRFTNADISASAAIAWSKMASLTASRVMVTTAGGVASASSVTDTILGYISGLTSDAQTQIDGKQATDTDLTAIAGLSSTGLIARTGSGTASVRTLTAPAAGITVSNGDGVSGNPTLALADDLSALEALSGTNTIYYRSGTSTWSGVTVSSDFTFSGGTLKNNGGRTIRSQSGTSYTFVLADGMSNGGNPEVHFTSGSAVSVTIPTNASVAFPVGEQIDACQLGAGKVTFSGSVTINSKDSNKAIGAQYVCVTLKKTATDTWLLIGDLIAWVLDLLRLQLHA